MRFALALLSLFLVANAKPQGYNYGTGISGTAGGFSSIGGVGSSGNKFQSAGNIGGFNSGASGSGFQSGGNIGGFTGGASGSGFSSGSNIGGFSGISSGGFGSGGFGSNAGSSHGFNGNGFGSGGSSSSGHFNNQQHGGGFESTLVHKQFITVSAPEDNESLEQSKNLVIGRPQKNYRVVFIKAPSSSNANVRLSAQYAPKEEKTVIYVLTKKDSALDVNDIATPEPTVPSKPEVFFIKYKTDAEASHAQQQIQAEYDKIEGTSEQIDGGVAPQQSVVGTLDNSNGNFGGASGSSGFGSGGSSGFTSGGSSGFTSGGSSGFGSSGSSGVSTSSSKGNTYLPPTTLV